jgi:hypothetical protein
VQRAADEAVGVGMRPPDGDIAFDDHTGTRHGLTIATGCDNYAEDPGPSEPRAACAAARRASGTR